MHRFAARLIEKQGGMTGAAFARLLGITPAEWSRIRLGRREPSRRIQGLVLRRWPELSGHLVEDLKEAS